MSLIGAGIGAGAGSAAGGKKVLDAVGNWKTMNTWTTPTTGPDAVNRDFNRQNQIKPANVGLTNPAYDNNGNLISDENNNKLTYDSWNRLAKFQTNPNQAGSSTVTYQYDSLGRRIAEITQTTDPGTNQ